MSIESNLTRIADALERIAAHVTNTPAPERRGPGRPPAEPAAPEAAVVPPAAPTPAPEPAPAASEPGEPAPKEYTLEDIRALGAKAVSKGLGGKEGAFTKLVHEYGAKKLSEIAPGDYAEFYEEASKLL